MSGQHKNRVTLGSEREATNAGGANTAAGTVILVNVNADSTVLNVSHCLRGCCRPLLGSPDGVAIYMEPWEVQILTTS